MVGTQGLKEQIKQVSTWERVWIQNQNRSMPLVKSPRMGISITFNNIFNYKNEKTLGLHRMVSFVFYV